MLVSVTLFAWPLAAASQSAVNLHALRGESTNKTTLASHPHHTRITPGLLASRGWMRSQFAGDVVRVKLRFKELDLLLLGQLSREELA